MCLGPELAAAASTVGELASTYAVPASLAATAAGTYAANRQAKAQQEALNRFSQADQQKQAALQTEANDKIKNAVQQFTPEQQAQQLAAATGTREAAMQPVAAPQPQYAPGTVAAPKEIKDDATRRIGDVMREGVLAASRKAKLGAFGDTSLAQGLALNRTGEDINRLSNFSAGDTRILPYELQSAALKGRNWASAADIANTAGQIGTLYGLTRRKPVGGNTNWAATQPANWQTDDGATY